MADNEQFSQRLFRILLRLFPREFRGEFGGEMQTVFHDQESDALSSGPGALASFVWRSSMEMIAAAAREHWQALIQDTGYALRLMRKSPSVSLTALMILGLAIGACTAAFTAANAVLIRPLPFARGNHLVHLQQRQPGAGVDQMAFSVPEIQDYRAQAASLDSVIEYHEMAFTLLGGREPARVDTGVVSANFFRALGTAPLYGRDFTDDDDRPNAPPVLILSYEFWQRSFGGDPAVVGKVFSMNDKEHIVVGVLPALPQFPEQVDVYMPTSACPTRSNPAFIHNRKGRMMSVFATLKPGTTLGQVQTELHTVAARLRSSYPDAYPDAKGYDAALTPVREELTRGIRPVLLALAVATGLLFFLACANVAGLLFSRMMYREKELAVRIALGASRGRMLRQFITEGLVLALGGGAAGLLLAYWSLGVVVRFTSRFTTLSSQLHIGWEVITFWALLSIAAGVLIGFVPAAGHRHMHSNAARAGSSSTPGRFTRRTRGVLVAVQLGASVILLVGAGLMLRSFLQLQHVTGGFAPGGVLTARVYRNKPQSNVFFDALLERTRHLPAVQSVGLATTFPLYPRGLGRSLPLEIRGEDRNDLHDIRTAVVRVVSTDYFSTIGVPLLSGRAFAASDNQQTPPVVIINQHMATHYWGAGSPLDKQISVFPGQWSTIIGVAGDVRQYGLDKDPADEIFGALAQNNSSPLSLLVRSSGPLTSLGRTIDHTVHDLDADAVLTDVAPMEEVRTESLASPRTTALFLGIFAVVALCITAAGVSGMMTLVVRERQPEIGIRLALGATPGVVMRAMMRQVSFLIIAGLGSGLAVAWLMSQSMSRLIFGIGPRDLATFAASTFLLGVVALFCSFVPLIRITKLDPTIVLRAE